jgi:hypothetical protein
MRSIYDDTNNLPSDPADQSLIIAATDAITTELAKVPKSDSNVTWNATAAAQIQSEAADALGAYDPPTRAELTSDINSVLAYLDGWVIAKGTIGATGNDPTHLHLAGLTYGNDEINNYLLAVKDVSAGEWHARYIEDWADTGDLATVATLPFTPEASVDLYVLLAFRQDVTGGAGLDAAGVRAAIGMASANMDTQLGDIPTVAEFNARTKPTADYFDWTTDQVIVTTNNDKTGYSLTQAFPSNFASLGINGSGHISRVTLTDTLTTYTSNTPQTGDSFARLGAPAGASISADIADVPTVAEFNARTPSATAATNMTTVFDTDFAANYNTTADAWVVDLERWAGTPVTVTVAGRPDINVAYVNGIQVDGVGSEADPWGPL